MRPILARLIVWRCHLSLSGARGEENNLPNIHQTIKNKKIRLRVFDLKRKDDRVWQAQGVINYLLLREHQTTVLLDDQVAVLCSH
jgi:hypothetical protein